MSPPFGGLVAKTYNNLYEQIYTFDRLHAAYLRARKGKRNRLEVMQFSQDLEGNLIALQNELIWQTYTTGIYRLFTVPEPKERLVAALPFRDRVVQHAIVEVIEPLWEARFISDSYACRVGKGTHAGADKAQSMLRAVARRHSKVYVLKADISKFFKSIDHDVTKRLIRKKIACKRTLALLDQIIDSSPDGLPIGNLTSQLLANVYLHELDIFAKHSLRERHYMRYMDDFCIVHHDKAHLQQLRATIEAFLWRELRLTTNAKTQVFPVAMSHGRGLDFLGYRIWPTHRRLRKSSISRMSRTLRKLQKQYARGQVGLDKISQSVSSWLAHAAHADTLGLRRSLLSRFAFIRSHVIPQETNPPATQPEAARPS